MPYIIVADAEKFIEFLTTVFGAEEKLCVRDDDGEIRHCEYSVFGGTIMFGQAGGPWKKFPCGMFVLVPDVRGLYQKGLDNGAKSLQEPGDHGYGLSAGFEDPFGNQWWLNDPDA
jgi:uncharacterized glyoxalase superfamily protein PhnB